jgi:purine-nucleoside phosphorylase
MDIAKLRRALDEAVTAVRARSPLAPRAGIVLGTGLGALPGRLTDAVGLPYDAIPHMPTPTVETHAGTLWLGQLEGLPVAICQGRFHRYEGHGWDAITFPVRLLRRLGAEILIVTNVAGGLNPYWSVGDLVLLVDHLNLLGDNPLVGPNLDEFGPRFPDMSEPYDRELVALAERIGAGLGLPLRRGVYAAVVGPNLETPAEYRVLRWLGADLVGMSTVPEVIVARHAGMRVLGVSILTDACLPDALAPVTLEQIVRVARQTEPKLVALVAGVAGALAQEGGAT